jgi:hypothetical protein
MVAGKRCGAGKCSHAVRAVRFCLQRHFTANDTVRAGDWQTRQMMLRWHAMLLERGP